MTQISLEKLGTAIDALYEAAALPELWESTLAKMASAVGGFGAAILHLPNDATGWHHISPDAHEMANAFFLGGWGPHNYRTNLGMQKIHAGRAVIHEQMLLDERAIDRQPIQVEFFNKFGMRAFVGFEFVPGLIGGSIERGNYRFQDWEINALSGFQHHFTRIGALALSRGSEYTRGMVDALRLLSRPSILLDGLGRVIEMNESAEALLPSTFVYHSRTLVPHDTDAQFDFGKMIDHVVKAARPREIEAHFPVILRRACAGPVISRVIPIHGPSTDVFQYAKAVLVLNTLSPPDPPGNQILRQTFRLTAAEARLAQKLAVGMDIPTAARELGISAGTARGYVKIIFQKAGVSRQAELVRLLSRLEL